MIFGVGTDIVKVSRFEKWVEEPFMIDRFFNEKEKSDSSNKSFLCNHYAKRFAAKEAFSKALGTGLSGFELKDVWVENNSLGKPELKFGATAQKKIDAIIGKDVKIHITLSDEKEYAIAFVIIECI